MGLSFLTLANSSTIRHMLYTLPLSQEETNDIVLVENYWHAGQALFIVYFREWNTNNSPEQILQMASQLWNDDSIRWD